MPDPDMQALIDAPLADALNLYLPKGRRTAKRAPKASYYDGIDAPRLSGKELAQRNTAQANAKHKQMLDYYGTTTVPFERVAQHCSITVEQAREAMLQRGRTE